MLTIEDLTNLIVLMNRAQYKDLNEAKAAVLLEQRLKGGIDRLKNPPHETGTDNPVDFPKETVHA